MKLDANDLRINNIVNAKNIPFIVAKIFTYNLRNEEYHIHAKKNYLGLYSVDQNPRRYIQQSFEQVSPVFLTRDWMITLGFEMDDNNGTIHHSDAFWRSKNPNFTLAIRLPLTKCGRDTIELYYVHQLQNLFYAFTREELILSID